MPITSQMVDSVQDGLPLEQNRLAEAMRREAFYNNDAERFIELREAQAAWDWIGMSKRYSGLTRQSVDLLSTHLYGSTGGPARCWCGPTNVEDKQGNDFLQCLYQDNIFDSVMLETDRHSTLNNVVAVRFDAGLSDRLHPLKLWTYTSGEFHVWTDPRDPARVLAVVIIERHDETTTYYLWDEYEVRIYKTDEATGTAGGRLAKQVGGEKHRYGILPFAFVWYELPTRLFWVSAPGKYLVDAEEVINTRLSHMEESIGRNLNPILLAKDVPAGWRAVLEPGRIMRLARRTPRVATDGDWSAGADPSVEVLNVVANIEQSWLDLHEYINLVRGNVGIPRESVSLDNDPVSGVALVIRQAPLIDRAKARRMIYQVFEQCIAKTALLCAGYHYANAAWVNAGLSGHLTTTWQEPKISIPGPDRDLLDQARISMRLASPLMIIQERYSVDRDRALEIAKQIAQDYTDLERISDLFQRPQLTAEVNTASESATDESTPGKNGEAVSESLRGSHEPSGDVQNV